MPSSSGLYDDSSDGESESNVLAPTDGYFNGRPAPSSDPLVRDPQQEERNAQEESDKAREAREAREESESSAAAQARREPQEIVRSPVSRRFLPDWEDERPTENSPLIPPSRSPAPPPAYEDATAGSSTPFSPSANRRPSGNSERSNHHTIERGPIFLPNGQPEDLGGDSPRDNGKESFWKRWSDWPWERFRPKHLVLMAATICALGFIISAIMRIVSAVHDSHQQPIGGLPSTGPSSCPTARYSMDGRFSFEYSDTFRFIQSLADYDSHDPARRVRSAGEIHIMPTLHHLEANIHVDVEMQYSDKALERNTAWYRRLDKLQLESPAALSAKTPNLSANPCTYTIVTVYVVPGTPMQLLDFTSSSFSITLHNELVLTAANLHIATASGNIAFPTEPGNASALNARNVIVDSTSGSITGSYRLLDLLKITSHSGSVNVDIEPGEAAVEDPKPAQLTLHTTSGSLTARTPAMFRALGPDGKSSVPPRDYKTSISSSSGSIRASLIHGSTTSIGCASGRIDMTLAPYGFHKTRSDIDVSSHSGSIDATVLPSLSDPGEPMRYLWSTYRYTSGSFRMNYPSDWEGRIEGSTMSGGITVDWPGVEVIEGGSPGGHVGFKRLKAVKGKGEGESSFNGMSGSATVTGPSDGARRGEGSGRGGKWWDGWVPEPPRWPGYRDEWGLRVGRRVEGVEKVEGSFNVVEE